MKYSIQLYSLRDVAEKDLEAGLKAVSEMGYEKVEFAGFGDKTAEEAAELLKKYNLEVSASHLSLNEVKPDAIEQTIANLKAIGDKCPCVPGMSISTKEKLDASIDVLNFAYDRFEKEGMKLMFHNHWLEFLPNEDGQIPFDEIYNRTKVNFEIDTYWAYAAKRDPIKLIEKLHNEGRLEHIHLKDGTGEAKGSAGRPLGMGSAPVKAVHDKAVEMGVDIIVESETLTPSGIEEARICIEYLKSINK